MRTTIDPKTKYSATDIVRQKLLPWALSPTKVSAVLRSGVLKTTETGESTQKRYVVAGKDLLAYIKKYGPVLMDTVYKTRTNDRSTKDPAHKHPRRALRTPGRAEAVR